jgi:hypothetical protein
MILYFKKYTKKYTAVATLASTPHGGCCPPILSGLHWPKMLLLGPVSVWSVNVPRLTTTWTFALPSFLFTAAVSPTYTLTWLALCPCLVVSNIYSPSLIGQRVGQRRFPWRPLPPPTAHAPWLTAGSLVTVYRPPSPLTEVRNLLRRCGPPSAPGWAYNIPPPPPIIPSRTAWWSGSTPA